IRRGTTERPAPQYVRQLSIPLRAAVALRHSARTNFPCRSAAWPEKAKFLSYVSRETIARSPRSAQAGAEALDAAAGVFQHLGGGGVGDAKIGLEPEGRALHHRDALLVEQRGAEIGVAGDLAAAGA